MQSPLQGALDRLHARFVALDAGEVATYIPELGGADPAHFAICCVTIDGHVSYAGDADERFTIQSISKPFVYGLALADAGTDGVMARVGLEPSGEAFNAISLEAESGRPRNPMINAGAIATASLIAGSSSDEKMSRVLEMLAAFAGSPLEIDAAVFGSERETGHRNRAIAHLLRNAGILGADVDAVLDRYFAQCSVVVTAKDLATMAATLANGGRNPSTDEQVIAHEHVERVLSVMSTCGMYDYAGSWLYRVGMPAKSGVAGGVIAVLPGQLGVGVYSPRLDSFGNSVRGVAVCEALSEEFGLHLLRPPVHPASVVMRTHTLAESGSRRRRGEDEARVIATAGKDVHVFRLQGPLAFSTAEVALRRAANVYLPGQTIVFDCARVDYTDGAASRLIQDFCNDVHATDGTLILAQLTDAQVAQAEAASEGGGGPLIFSDADSALEWCEDRILTEARVERRAGEEMPIAEHPLLRSCTAAEVRAFIAVATRVCYEDGDAVVRQGDPADAIYCIVNGGAAIHLNLPGERRLRLTTLSAGATFGELALMDERPRTADVIADGALTCYELRVEDLAALDVTAPALRAKLTEEIARDLAARLRRADLEIATLAG